MIILKKIEFGFWFSYGDANVVNLCSNNLTQIVGVNGAGKSSIPIIIEETLYNKNSKNIKKKDLSNRNLSNCSPYSTIEFSKFENTYVVKLIRGSSTKLSIFCNGKDISSHTATNTYKTIQEILGLDFKTFSQLLYQSSTTNLHFLTDTDAQRKAFLVKLFGLDSYLDKQEVFKNAAKEAQRAVDTLRGEINIIDKWILNYSERDLEDKPLQDVPEVPNEDDLLSKVELMGRISSENRDINANNEYIRLLGSIDISNVVFDIEKGAIEALKEEEENINKSLAQVETEVRLLNKAIKELESIPETCPTCSQSWPIKKQEEVISLKKSDSLELGSVLKKYKEEKSRVSSQIRNANRVHKEFIDYQDKIKEVEKLSILVDNEMPTEIYNIEKLATEIETLKDNIKKTKDIINRAEAYNSKAMQHNSKIDTLKKELDNYKNSQQKTNARLEIESTELLYLQVLRDAFGSKGLLAYKLEFLVKDLEKEINKYLGIFTRGIFNIEFYLEKDKLNVSIISKSGSVELSSLSAGELSRVNVSTLLAIRKLMTGLSGSQVNLLFLDEVTGVLDDEGKEQLISVLSTEQDLNTFLISHDYSHPLIPKIRVEKHEDISRITDGN